MKKKYLVFIVSVSLIFNLTMINTTAKESNKKNKEANISQLKDYIKKGKGTKNDPYVIDESCPYKEILDQNIALLFEENNYTLPYIGMKGFTVLGSRYQSFPLRAYNLLTDFNPYLTSIYGTVQLGGKWKCTSYNSSSKVQSDGNCWIQSITYFPHTDKGFKDLYKSRMSSVMPFVTSSAFSVGGDSLKKALIAKGFEASAATFWSLAIGVPIFVGAANVYTDQIIKTADNNHWGLLTVNYATSYHGSWYTTSTVCYWKNYSTVKLPSSYYGVGNFKAYTSSDWAGYQMYVG